MKKRKTWAQKRVESWVQTVKDHTRILRTEIYSCFKCDHLSFHVGYPNRCVYHMSCDHPKGKFKWEDKSDGIDYRPDGLIPKQCPLEKPKC